METKESLSKLTVVKLKERCKTLGIKCYGRKADIVDKLHEYLNDSLNKNKAQTAAITTPKPTTQQLELAGEWERKVMEHDFEFYQRVKPLIPLIPDFREWRDLFAKDSYLRTNSSVKDDMDLKAVKWLWIYSELEALGRPENEKYEIAAKESLFGVPIADDILLLDKLTKGEHIGDYLRSYTYTSYGTIVSKDYLRYIISTYPTLLWIAFQSGENDHRIKEIVTKAGIWKNNPYKIFRIDEISLNDIRDIETAKEYREFEESKYPENAKLLKNTYQHWAFYYVDKPYEFIFSNLFYLSTFGFDRLVDRLLYEVIVNKQIDFANYLLDTPLETSSDYSESVPVVNSKVLQYGILAILKSKSEQIHRLLPKLLNDTRLDKSTLLETIFAGKSFHSLNDELLVEIIKSPDIPVTTNTVNDYIKNFYIYFNKDYYDKVLLELLRRLPKGLSKKTIEIAKGKTDSSLKFLKEYKKFL